MDQNYQFAVCSLNVVDPIAANFTGITNVIGAFNVTGIAAQAGADVKASVNVFKIVEAGATANASANATAGGKPVQFKRNSGVSVVAAPFKQFDIKHPTK